MTLTTPMTRIFCVEDEHIVARDIRQQLIRLGYDPAGHAVRAEDAIEKIALDPPDLVLMDIQLAGAMDGITAAQQLNERFDLPVVFLTAFAADDVLERAKLTEPYGYILKPFSERELRTVVEMALYKSRADRAMRTQAAEIQRMARMVIETQEQERRRLSLELHDELGQSLTSIKINLATRKLLNPEEAAAMDVRNLIIIDDAIQHVRDLALNLRPGMLDVLGLTAALEAMVEKRFASGLPVATFASMLGARRLRPEVEIAVFRIAQESLTNIQRHAQATTVTITLDADAELVVLAITDNGQGFDARSSGPSRAAPKGLGLVGMEERAHQIGATLGIASSPGEGCCIQLVCPNAY
jgi:signal transduction histidine kinase